MTPHVPSAVRTRALFCVVAAALTASAAAATTRHRDAISQVTGSEGASTTLQTSASSSAIQGEVASSANTSVKLPFGVLGQYNASSSTFGIGVVGLSTSGYGVAAESFGSNPSLIAVGGGSNDAFDVVENTGGNAIVASSSGEDATIIAEAYAGYAVDGTSNSNTAINGISTTGTGVSGSSTTGAGISGTAPGTVVGGSDSDLASVGVAAGAQVGTGALIQNNSEYNPTLNVNNYYSGAAGFLIEAGANGGNSPKFSVNGVGDLYTAGSITSGTATVNAVSRNPGNSMLTYAPQQSEASMEDVGSARLIDGIASVPLAADFQQTIDTSVPYAVFLTPYADNHGLYVASRTPTGFVVREALGGRSSLSFDYRIVAKPYGSRLARLPHVERPKVMPSRAAALLRPGSLAIPTSVRAHAEAAVARAKKNAETMSAVRR